MSKIDFVHHKAARLALIDDLEAGKLDKPGFIQANVALYDNLSIQEPKQVTCIDQGVFYYQYYNTMAKFHQVKYRELKYKDPFVAVDHRKLSDKLYLTKERVTYRMISSLKNHELEAYYVKSDSKKLKRRLIEIVVLTQDKVILHSLDDKVVVALKSRKILSEGIKPSKIESYINKRYYQID